MPNHPQRFLYVIAASPAGPVKLGVSNDPERRLRQLQTGHAERLHLFHTEPVDSERSRLFERLLHRDINHHRQHGEWFRLTAEAAILHVQFTIIEYDLEPDLQHCLHNPAHFYPARP